MTEIPSNQQIVIDASFIRSMSGEARPFHLLAENCNRIVIIDNLAFELCSTENRAHWPASQLKLMGCRAAVDCWHNTGVMLRVEGERNQPYGDPLFPESTSIMRSLLETNSPYVPDDLVAQTEMERVTREGPILSKMFTALSALRRLATTIEPRIKGQDPFAPDVQEMCYGFVNNVENIRTLMSGGPPVPSPADVDDTWVTWHHYKAFLAMFCDWLRRDAPDSFEDLSDKAKKRWINIKHDLEYLVSLAFADAIASGETQGEQSYYRRWMFGDTKPLITFTDFQ